MKTKTITTNIGTVDFSKVELLGGIEMYFDIDTLSEDIQSEVTKEIEKKKAEYIKHWQEIYEEKGLRYSEKWSEKGITTSPQLYIYLPENGEVQYCLCVYFEDLENSDMADSIYIEIELSKYERDLKFLIMEALMRKFF